MIRGESSSGEDGLGNDGFGSFSSMRPVASTPLMSSIVTVTPPSAPPEYTETPGAGFESLHFNVAAPQTRSFNDIMAAQAAAAPVVLPRPVVSLPRPVPFIVASLPAPPVIVPIPVTARTPVTLTDVLHTASIAAVVPPVKAPNYALWVVIAVAAYFLLHHKG